MKTTQMQDEEGAAIILSTKPAYGKCFSFLSDVKMTTALLDRVSRRRKITENGYENWRFKYWA